MPDPQVLYDLISANLFLDPQFERWGSATDLTHWTEVITGGSSVVTREPTTVHRGAYACRITVDGAGFAVGVRQAVTLAATPYSLSVVHIDSNAIALVSVQNMTTNNYWRTSDETWGALEFNALTARGSFTRDTITNFTPESAASHEITFLSATPDGVVIFDEARILPVAKQPGPSHLYNNPALQWQLRRMQPSLANYLDP